VKQTSPVGVFPSGRTREGVDDLSGNVFEWTSSLFGPDDEGDSDTTYPYPYDPADGREDPDAPPNVRRVLRGGAWNLAQSNTRAVSRMEGPPTSRVSHYGFRIVLAGAV